MNPVNIGFLLEWEQDRRLRLPLPPGGMTLGRGPGNDYSFPEEDLAPIQCKLFQRDRRVHILDLSGKGTDVNGKLVEQGRSCGERVHPTWAVYPAADRTSGRNFVSRSSENAKAFPRRTEGCEC